MGSPQSSEEARRHIEDVREGRGLSETGSQSRNVADLQASLEMYVLASFILYIQSVDCANVVIRPKFFH
jgi:hypothetical protein